MNTASTLTITDDVYQQVRRHLFPGDDLESAAILFCVKTGTDRTRLIAREALLISHSACRREKDFITWPGSYIEDAIDRAESEDLALILLHSHPGGLFAFSSLDDASDRSTMPGLFQALGELHGSAIMTPDGAVLARLYSPDLVPRPVEFVTCTGDDIRYWWADRSSGKRALAFTSDMTRELSRLTACVIGVSGTGSIVAEQLARLGFGHVILIDYDTVEHKNLNRILNSTLDDANTHQSKVDSFARSIELHRGVGVAIPIDAKIGSRRAVLSAAESDVLFSCTDTHEARHYADRIASAYAIPLVDVGVSIPTRSNGTQQSIVDVLGRVDYVRPGGPTLLDRSVYSPETLRAEYLRSTAPDDHRHEVHAGYIKGVQEEAPAVISLNMRAGSFAVMEFLARVYTIRTDGNHAFARTLFSIAEGDEDHFSEDCFQWTKNSTAIRGSREPLLDLPELALPRRRLAK
ncbi:MULTISPECIES: ThiF family adenylyltransferase [Burkholderia]|uniref:ThiF family adenylyltransferase n=1 Tax=Burkholderia TaxID=32008 RepID=UPI001641479E|nr:MULTISPECIES: ThiF family adenylyltransferase [Burkholderia]UVS94933.1 ThiF family adenylyltransferase [Burkholderia glumae]